MTRFPPKPPAPSVRETVGAAIARSRGLVKDEHPMTEREIIEDIIAKLDLPAAVQARLRQRHRPQ
jgi:hypothetical protein